MQIFVNKKNQTELFRGHFFAILTVFYLNFFKSIEGMSLSLSNVKIWCSVLEYGIFKDKNYLFIYFIMPKWLKFFLYQNRLIDTNQTKAFGDKNCVEITQESISNKIL